MEVEREEGVQEGKKGGVNRRSTQPSQVSAPFLSLPSFTWFPLAICALLLLNHLLCKILLMMINELIIQGSYYSEHRQLVWVWPWRQNTLTVFLLCSLETPWAISTHSENIEPLWYGRCCSHNNHGTKELMTNSILPHRYTLKAYKVKLYSYYI